VTLTPAAKTLMVLMSVLAAVDTKEMDALAWVSMKDVVSEIRIKKDLKVAYYSFIRVQEVCSINVQI